MKPAGGHDEIRRMNDAHPSTRPSTMPVDSMVSFTAFRPTQVPAKRESAQP